MAKLPGPSQSPPVPATPHTARTLVSVPTPSDLGLVVPDNWIAPSYLVRFLFSFESLTISHERLVFLLCSCSQI